MATPSDVVVLKCRKICPTGNRRNRALFTGPKNLGSLSNGRPKSAKASANNVLTVLQISSKSIHFRRSTAERVNIIFAPKNISPIGSSSL